MFAIRDGEGVAVKSCFMAVLSVLLIASPASAQKGPQASSASTAQTDRPFQFEVVSIRPHPAGTMPYPTVFTPDSYSETETISEMIMQAYNPQPWRYWSRSKIQDAPAWVANDRYDINARVADADVAAWKEVLYQNSGLLRSAMQSMLKERFKLELHRTPIEADYLDLVMNKQTAKLQDTVPGKVKPIPGKTRKVGQGLAIEEDGEMQFVGVSMEEFAEFLTLMSRDNPVQDKTGLLGRYDFTLPWYDYRRYPNSEFSNPLSRIQIKDIGLTLKPGKGPAYIFTIDHIERPDPN